MLAVSGLHSRSEATIQATQDWERSRLSSKELHDQFARDVREFILLQKGLGFDFVSDGQLTPKWQDIFRPITNHVSGVKKGPLVRWFNTNTFYYAPVIEEEISSGGGIISRSIENGLLNGCRTKVVVPDPLTFVECSDDRYYGSREKLLFAYCDKVLRPELLTLESSGVDYVQFSAPALVARFRGEPVGKDLLSQLAEALRGALRGSRLRTGYHTFFGDASRYLPGLLDLIPTDDVGFDLSETDPNVIPETGKGVIAGVADSRSSYVERPAEIVRKLGRIRDRASRIVLSPSSDLQYVPRVVADRKLESLARARRMLL